MAHDFDRIQYSRSGIADTTLNSHEYNCNNQDRIVYRETNRSIYGSNIKIRNWKKFRKTKFR